MEDSSAFIEKMLELGIGMSMIKQVPDIMSGCLPSPPSQKTALGQTPPPAAQRMTYLVVDGSQAGPFNNDELMRLIQNDLLKRDTLVWMEGLSNWMPASSVPEINKLFVIAKIK